MKKENETQERQRKAYARAGERSQKMMAFRVDNDNLEFLNAQPNKGRFLNNLIAAARRQEKGA